MKTIVICDEDPAIDLAVAAAALTQGKLVAVPTETVYGLAANGLNCEAVERVYDIKGRPAIKPLSLLVPNIKAAETLCGAVPDGALALAEAFWPGPLTIVLHRLGNVPDIVTAGGDTVGLRCPDHPKTIELLRLAGVPAAAPSANPSGMPSPKTAEEVLEYFDGMIEYIVDGGRCRLGTESTIIDLTVSPPKIIRQGALAEIEIREVLNKC